MAGERGGCNDAEGSVTAHIKEVTATIAWAPCPPEKLPGLRYGINLLFDMLESLPAIPAPEQEKKSGIKYTIIGGVNGPRTGIL